MDDKLEQVVSAPAVALESTIEETRNIAKKFTSQRSVKKANRYWKMLGPGLTTGAADDDPSGIATYSQTGAQYGFNLLWLAGFTFPFMAIVQEMCARLGLVTGRGLAANIRKHYPRRVLYVCTLLLFVANTFNIGADLGAMAKATQLILPNVPFTILIISFTLISLGLQIFSTYEKYAKYLKYLALILVSYIVSGFLIEVDWRNILQIAATPSLVFSKDQIILVCAVLGTTISPYLFFWQTSQEVEEGKLDGKMTNKVMQVVHKSGLRRMRIDVWSGMFISNLVMFFIIMTCAATLYKNGINNITSAEQAAAALRPFAGQMTYLLFTLGIIGTGMLAVPVLAGASSYAISESFGWKFGLSRKLKKASAFYGVIIISMILGLVMNLLGMDPIKTLIYSAVLNGLVAPVVLVLIILMSSNTKIMGEHVNGYITSFFGWLITFIMILAGIATLAALFI